MNGYYRSFDDEMREMFGGKVYRLALSASHTCPNRDGHCGTGGCIFCSVGGSGDFAEDKGTIDEQLERAKLRVRNKLSQSFAGYMAYFQSFTETYGDTDYLAGCFEQAAAHPEVLALSIATRPDSVSDEMIARLQAINERKPVYVELGLQTVHEDTARYINRCYELPVFEDAFRRLKGAGLKVVVHVIIGLPNEDETRTAETVKYLANLTTPDGRHIDGIKLQLLHVLKGTALAERMPQSHEAAYTDNYSDICPETDTQDADCTEYTERKSDAADQDNFGQKAACACQSSSDYSIFHKKEHGEGRLILNDGAFLTCYNMTNYAELIVRLIAMLPKDITIHRITGDAPKSLLIWPLWTADKKRVLNTISKVFAESAAVKLEACMRQQNVSASSVLLAPTEVKHRCGSESAHSNYTKWRL